ncbi:D-aminopeptidase [Litorimonas taeanensis]|uniref:D-aminopeptidase n=1 Tax=Litorimonas taeanensis TaxID=568099 RepID=A0A420WE03_9PROT|nr:P1 family peptidase [Litorimonas taeanensis]RKQ69140.1 D-aminopeptidase [Litorimonas taeanensis]
MEQHPIFDIGGFRLGQAHDEAVNTGVTVILPEQAATCAVDVRGGGPGTREIMALQDGGLIDSVHAVVLSGGSVYGLAAADGVTAWLGEQRIGYAPGPEPVPVSPIVPSAILFDNANGGQKLWGLNPPFRDLAIQACEGAETRLSEGKAGAGFGATAGLYAGGLGAAVESVGDVKIGAIIAANPVGSPYMPGSKCPWAWPYEVDNEFGGQQPPKGYSLSEAKDTKLAFLKEAGQSTVIGAIVTDAGLSQKQLRRISIMAQDGIAMAVQPSHTLLDGDTIFALSTGNKPCETPVALAELGAAAARVVARALMRGVYFAQA